LSRIQGDKTRNRDVTCQFCYFGRDSALRCPDAAARQSLP
jgi:hypothetical protein